MLSASYTNWEKTLSDLLENANVTVNLFLIWTVPGDSVEKILLGWFPQTLIIWET